MTTPSNALAVLSHHVGAGNGITAAALARELNVSTRQLRGMISDLRDDGVAICASPETGYFIAETAEELEITCQFLHARAMHSLVLISRLRKVPLPDLLGQMKLRT